MSKRNENRPGYKETKVGWIPKEWQVVRLKNCAEILFSNVDKKTNNNEYPVKLCNYIDVYYNELITNKIDFMRATATQAEIKKFSLKKGDVIITKDSEDADDIAVPAFVAENFDNVLCGYHLALIRPDRNTLLGEYLSRLFQLHVFRHYFSTLANGVTRFGLTSQVTLQAQIPLPPLPEQKKIAEILSAWDRAIEQVGKLIDAKQRLKKGLMQQLLTGRMRFPEFGKPVQKKGELPEGWREVRLGDVCKIAYGKDWKAVASKENAYPVYGTGGVIGYATSPLSSGPSILLGRKGTIDNPVYINSPFWAVDTTFYTEIKKGINPKFIFFLFCRIRWRRYNEASGVPSLSRSTIAKIKLSIPSLTEQTRIAAVLSACDREIELLKKKQEKLREQKKGLMQKLLTGEVRHPDFYLKEGIHEI